MSFPCPLAGCGRRATEWAICRTCAEGLARDLDAIPDLAVEVETTLARRSVSTARGGPRASTAALAYDPRASAAYGALKAVLVGWVRDLAEGTDRAWPADTAADCARWLGRALPELRVHPAAVEITVEIGEVVARCRRAIDRAPDRRIAGPCDICATPLYAVGEATCIRCARCHATYDLGERRTRLLAAAAEELLTVPDLLRVLPGWTGTDLKGSTLRSWRQRGQLVPVASVGGRELFRLADVVALLGPGAVA